MSATARARIGCLAVVLCTGAAGAQPAPGPGAPEELQSLADGLMARHLEARVHDPTVTLAALVWIALLDYWNLLGFRY